MLIAYHRLNPPSTHRLAAGPASNWLCQCSMRIDVDEMPSMDEIGLRIAQANQNHLPSAKLDDPVLAKGSSCRS
jgi:hypothetical protein